MSRICRQTTFYKKDVSLEKQIANAKMSEKADAILKEREAEKKQIEKKEAQEESTSTIGLKQ